MKKINIKYYKSALVILALAFALPIFGSAAQNGRAELQDNIQGQRETFRTEVEALREQTRNQLEANREEFQDELEDMRENGSTTREMIEAKIRQMRSENELLRASTTEALKREREMFREEIKNQIMQYKDAAKVKLDQAKTANVLSNITKAFEKIYDALVRFDKFDSNLTARIADANVKGRDTTNAEEALAVARTSLADAKIAIADIESGIKTAVASSTSNGIAKEALRDAMNQAMEIIKATREKYRLAVVALAQGERSVPNSENSSSTEN